jgi:hypothetical protein
MYLVHIPGHAAVSRFLVFIVLRLLCCFRYNLPSTTPFSLSISSFCSFVFPISCSVSSSAHLSLFPNVRSMSSMITPRSFWRNSSFTAILRRSSCEKVFEFESYIGVNTLYSPTIQIIILIIAKLTALGTLLKL